MNSGLALFGVYDLSLIRLVFDVAGASFKNEVHSSQSLCFLTMAREV